MSSFAPISSGAKCTHDKWLMCGDSRSKQRIGMCNGAQLLPIIACCHRFVSTRRFWFDRNLRRETTVEAAARSSEVYLRCPEEPGWIRRQAIWSLMKMWVLEGRKLSGRVGRSCQVSVNLLVFARRVPFLIPPQRKTYLRMIKLSVKVSVRLSRKTGERK